MKTKHINFFALGISFVFMFNPNINIIDLLPDFIGYIILCVALTPLSDINEHMAEAYAGFKRMIFIDAAKVLAFVWVFGISVTSEYNSSLMLWSFIFGIVELIFLLTLINTVTASALVILLVGFKFPLSSPLKYPASKAPST